MDRRAVWDGVQSSGSGQSGHLIVGKGEHVRAPLQIGQQHILAVGFALGLEGDLEAGLIGVMGSERGEDLLEQRLVLLCAPHGQLDGLRSCSAFRGGLLSAAGRQWDQQQRAQQKR